MREGPARRTRGDVAKNEHAKQGDLKNSISRESEDTPSIFFFFKCRGDYKD